MRMSKTPSRNVFTKWFAAVHSIYLQQQQIAADWTSAYEKYFHTINRCLRNCSARPLLGSAVAGRFSGWGERTELGLREFQKERDSRSNEEIRLSFAEVE